MWPSFFILMAAAAPLAAQRVTVPLDGQWQIEDSIRPEAVPQAWRHMVHVPGMANQAMPAFPDVDRYMTSDYIYDLTLVNLLPKNGPSPQPGPRQERNWFWYRKTFRVGARKQTAILRINKAQFSTSVWLNGAKIGDHLGCFTAAVFDLTPAMDWTGENTLLVRVGAHPGVMPPDVPAGTDYEKSRWTPGIYDSVSVLLSDNPVIETVQVAPRINPAAVTVQTVLRNFGASNVQAKLTQTVKTWRGGNSVAAAEALSVNLAAGEQKTLTQTIAFTGAHLWTPEDPFLYVLDSSTGGDSASTRFGVREFRFDTATKRAFLNGRPYFMRGSNITLHRFLEDPNVGSLPWNDEWVRKMLVEIPKGLNWNTFRFCIGPVPDRWLDLADEYGFLIQNEYFIWTGGKSWKVLHRWKWNSDELIAQYKEWLRDNWNHPSVVIWDANNETGDDVFHEKVIPAVRHLDLTARPWENSYNPPAGPEDPIEDHPYLFSRGTMGGSGAIFSMTELESMNGSPRGGGTIPSVHARILNEYGWLWLQRDGTPCPVSKPVYDAILGPGATPEDRIELNGYYVGGLTEYWRAFRNFAAVMHFVYLTSSYPNAITSDNFKDVVQLRLHDSFLSYVGEAFKPLGVYIHFWQPELAASSVRSYSVMMVNDFYETSAGKLVLSFENEAGGEAVRVERPFSIPGLGQETYLIELPSPAREGKYILKATAYPASGPAKGPTVSRRKLKVARSDPPA